MTTATGVPRPKDNAPSILEKAAEMLAPSVMEWCQQEDGWLRDDDLPDFKHDLSDVMKRTWYKGGDGYDLAKALEDMHGYSPNSELVDILNDAARHVREAHEKAVKNWVKDNNIVVPFAIGDKVKVKQPFKKDVIGTITKIDAETAICFVNCPELGHRPPGTQGKLPGSHAILIAYEALTKEV